MIILISAILNLSFVALAWLGVQDNGAAYNLLRFFIWIQFLIAFFTLFIPKSDRAKIALKLNERPQWIGASCDLAAVIILASFGWFFSASLWLFSTLCDTALRGTKETPST